MPGADIAQYGLATFAVAGLIYVVVQFLKQRGNQNIMSVVENNTKALEQVASVIQAMQLAQTRQETKLDELLERARR